MLAYTVFCDFTNASVADRWVQWLLEEHVEDVCRAGALSAEVVRADTPPDGSAARCEVRYRFASRADFDRYERDHAPRLRAEGLRRFPLEEGLRYTRSTGEILAGAQSTSAARG